MSLAEGTIQALRICEACYCSEGKCSWRTSSGHHAAKATQMMLRRESAQDIRGSIFVPGATQTWNLVCKNIMSCDSPSDSAHWDNKRSIAPLPAPPRCHLPRHSALPCRCSVKQLERAKNCWKVRRHRRLRPRPNINCGRGSVPGLFETRGATRHPATQC